MKSFVYPKVNLQKICFKSFEFDWVWLDLDFARYLAKQPRGRFEHSSLKLSNYRIILIW